jgi:nitrogen fixation protein NifU and related proteins
MAQFGLGSARGTRALPKLSHYPVCGNQIYASVLNFKIRNFSLLWHYVAMNDDLQKRIQAALANPQNMGEMTGADSIGTVGNADCGEMLRLWVKFKEQNGKRVIDRATFQSFGCETAIAVASLATELIRGKTAEEALALKTEELAGELGPLPPMKIHCAQLVEGALRSALEPEKVETKIEKTSAPSSGSNLLDSFSKPKEGVKLTFLD